MSARFILPLNEPAEGSLKLNDRFFKYHAFDPDTEAYLLAQSEQIFIKQYTVISNDHDDYGSTTNYSSHCIRLSELCSMSEISDTYGYFGDIMVKDGKVDGVIMYRGSVTQTELGNGKYEYRTPLYDASECEHDVFAFLYADGRTEGAYESHYCTSTDRSESSHSIYYSITDKFVPDWRNSSWD